MSFVAESRERSRPVLPLAGMVDVLFLLLIFFMTASVFRDQELMIDVRLPTAETARPSPDRAAQIVVTVTDEDRVYLGDRAVAVGDLPAMFRELADHFPGESVVVRGDRAASFGLAVQIMDLAQQAGIEDVSVATIKSVDKLE